MQRLVNSVNINPAYYSKVASHVYSIVSNVMLLLVSLNLFDILLSYSVLQWL